MWTCQLCGGIVETLGWFGRLLHGRCEDCGMMHSKDAGTYSDWEVDDAWE